MRAPLRSDEGARLRELRDLGILDTDPEPDFDRVTRLATRLFDVPIALVSLVDEDRQWLKSCTGLFERETTRDVSFCAHAILDDRPMVVPDASNDPRFEQNPLVTGEPGIRFYAGAPLRTASGHKLGTLCVIDTRPRHDFDATLQEHLADLAALVTRLIEDRRIADRLGAFRSHLAAIVESSDDAIFSEDLDGTILSWNAGAEALYGYSAEEAIGRNVSTLVPPDRDDEIALILERIGRGERLQHFETGRMAKDGREIPVALTVSPTRDADGTVTGVSTIARDVTELKSAEAELRSSEAYLRAVLNNMADGVIVTDLEGNILLINPAMEKLAGWSLDETRGREVTDVYRSVDEHGRPAARDEPASQERAEALERGEVARSEGTETWMTRTGEKVPVAWSAAKMRDEDGRGLGYVIVIRDVSCELEVDRLKSSLISTVSHELRTPLTMIQGFAELLLTRAMGAVQAREAHERILSSAERLSRLIDDLLDVSRIDSGRLTLDVRPIDLGPTIAEVLDPFQTHDSREFRVEVEDGLPRVSADADRLHQILTNLVSNAVKYSPAGAPVDVRARIRDAEVQVSVEDRGVGLTPEHMDRLFEKFFRVQSTDVREVPGTGLGLYITKSLVERQGGRIWVNSEPGAGSTFYFTLPVAEDAVSAEDARDLEAI